MMTVLLLLGLVWLLLIVQRVIPMQDISASRTVPMDIAPGWAGFIQLGGASLNLTKWTPRIRAEPIEITNFNSPNDPVTGVRYKEWSPSTVDGEFTIEGVRDFSISGWNPMPTMAGTAFFAYDLNLGFEVNILVIDIGGEQDVNRVGMFSATVKANGFIDFLGRNDRQDLITTAML